MKIFYTPIRKYLYALLIIATLPCFATSLSAQVIHTANVITPGTLGSDEPAGYYQTVTNLTIKGNIDSRDFLFLQIHAYALETLDLSAVKIIAYTHGQSGDPNYDAASCPANELAGLGGTISGYSFNLKSIILPNSITSIGSGALANNYFTNVTIPNSVVTIGDRAFQGCSSLTNITFGNSVSNLGVSVFEGCSSLKVVTLPNSVTNVGASAFSACTSLTNLTFGNFVTSIGADAFNGCSNLTTLTIPNLVKSIEKETFYQCTGLTNLTFNNSVTNIGELAFHGCIGLKTINIPNSVTNISNDAFSGCTGLTSLTLGNSITNIGTSAFNGCIGIQSVRIPNSVTNIGDFSFSTCTSLSSLSLGNSVTTIGIDAFYGCSSLITLIIPNSVKSIGNDAFLGCTGITYLIIGNSVTNIGDRSFLSCTGLKQIYSLNSTPPILGSICFNTLSSVVTDVFVSTDNAVIAYKANTNWISSFPGTIIKKGIYAGDNTNYIQNDLSYNIIPSDNNLYSMTLYANEKRYYSIDLTSNVAAQSVSLNFLKSDNSSIYSVDRVIESASNNGISGSTYSYTIKFSFIPNVLATFDTETINNKIDITLLNSSKTIVAEYIKNNIWLKIRSTPTAIETISIDKNDYKVYYNKNTNELTINRSTDFNDGFFQIFDLYGHLIFSNQLESNNSKYRLPKLRTGIYFARLNVGGTISSEKFIAY